MDIEFSLIQSVGFSIVVLIIGMWLKRRIYFFERFAIPSPVIGGFLFAIINLILRQTGLANITFDVTVQSFFMVIFFTSVGYGASIKVLKKAGPKVMVFLVLCTVLCFFQDLVAVLLAPLVGVSKDLALMTGSVSMTGGHGVSGAISPLVEESGVTGAETVAYTSATFGLVAGSLLGGPIANRLILKHQLHKQESEKVHIDTSLLEQGVRKLRQDRIMHAFIMILLAMFIGSFITDFLNTWVGTFTEKAAFPVYLGTMLVAVFFRYINDKYEQREYEELVPVQEVEIVGTVGLNIFLAMALMNVRLWELADVAVPLLVLLLGQVILMATAAYFITFRVMGKNYDAAVLVAGQVGFGMGATPNGMANMESVTAKFKPSPLAFFIVPIVGGMFIDFTNLFIILGFLNFA